MIIYQDTKSNFINDVDHNNLLKRLEDAFQSKTSSIPTDRYVWSDEYSRFSLALRNASVDDDINVAIEYHISAAGRFRVDVLLSGNDGLTDNGLIIELKAWDRADLSDVPEMVISPVGGGIIKEHPCLQARKYKLLILRFNQDIAEKDIKLHSAAYLFNLHRRNPEPLEDPRYQHIISDSRLFLAEDVADLQGYLEKVVPRKAKRDVLYHIENGRLSPTEELISRVSSMLDGNEEFELIGEQNEAFQIIRHQVVEEQNLTHRHVFVVKGGPGTGKSVIAVRLLAEILKQKRMGFFVAPNAAFRNTLIEYLAKSKGGKGNHGYTEDGQAILRSSWSFHEADYRKNSQIEVLIVDEAHRLKGEGTYQYRGKSMVEDMVRAARISVFFIDETQRVSWQDIGSVDAIKHAAEKYKAIYHEPYTLTAQFRCNGSSGYLNWLDDVLQLRSTGNYDNWGNGQYEFKVFDHAEDLYAALKRKNTTNKARLIAGYSWVWPKQGRKRGANVMHVKADRLSLPWNYDGENWATNKDGIEQVGCVHTCQGLEFDWLGVLIGPDLAFKDGRVFGDPEKRARTDSSLNGWKKNMQEAKGSPDTEKAVQDKVQEIIKSTYKVLLSRGRMGCYVWCADEGMREYLKQRLTLTNAPADNIVVFPLSLIQHPGKSRFVKHLPVYSLKAAAGYFGNNEAVEPLGWVEVSGIGKLTEDMFVAQVVGHSMEPLINDGDFCIFKANPEGSRNGSIVLVQYRGPADTETGGSYTVKKYQSVKTIGADGDWRHDKITLSPLNHDYEAIVLDARDETAVKVLAVFKQKLVKD